MSYFHYFCLFAGNLQPNFQIALTHSISKLESIVIPPDKMSQNGEKYAQGWNLIRCILIALRQNLKTSIILKDPVVLVHV